MESESTTANRPHKKLELWKRSMDLVTLIYEITRSFPKDEDFGLKSQLRRASVSVPSNIAEGLARKTMNDKLHFLNIAQGSLSEVDTQIELAMRLSYIDIINYRNVEARLVDIQKLLSGLVRSLKN